jgi:predicted transcriptional regulator YdeE
MDSETVTLEEFKVAGISVRTTNQNGQSKKDISTLWSRFMSENIAGKIPGKVNRNLYCIYTDYESDFMGAYTTILGFEVTSVENLPEELIVRTIPASAYRPFISIGKLPDSVLNTWKYIWESGIKRKYSADFDIYPPDAFSSGNPVVETYLSV